MSVAGFGVDLDQFSACPPRVKFGAGLVRQVVDTRVIESVLAIQSEIDFQLSDSLARKAHDQISTDPRHGGGGKIEGQVRLRGVVDATQQVQVVRVRRLHAETQTVDAMFGHHCEFVTISAAGVGFAGPFIIVGQLDVIAYASKQPGKQGR